RHEKCLVCTFFHRYQRFIYSAILLRESRCLSTLARNLHRARAVSWRSHYKLNKRLGVRPNLRCVTPPLLVTKKLENFNDTSFLVVPHLCWLQHIRFRGCHSERSHK